MIKKKKKKRKGWGDQIFANDTVCVADVVADPAMQQRAEMRSHIIDEYTEILSEGQKLAPIKLVRDKNDTLWLWDGFHTLEAAKRAGAKEIKAEITDGTKHDAWLKSLGANAKHGIRRSRQDKQKAIDSALSDPEIRKSLIEENGLYSFREVAKLCNVHHQMVSRRWKNIHLERIEKDIEQALRAGRPKSLLDAEWFTQIAEKLAVPAWLVEARFTELRTTPTPSPAPDTTSVYQLMDGRSSTDQPNSAQSGGEEDTTSENQLIDGGSSTDQPNSARFGGEEDAPSENQLMSGGSSTHQPNSARSGGDSNATSESQLIDGGSSTDQPNSARFGGDSNATSDHQLMGGGSSTDQPNSARSGGDSNATSDHQLMGGGSSTDQPNSARSRDEENATSKNQLMGGGSSTHQPNSARSRDEEDATSENQLMGGGSSTDQPNSARSRNEEDATSENQLMGGGSSTDQVSQTQLIPPSAPIKTEITRLSNSVSIHKPTTDQLHRGGEATRILTRYVSSQFGVKVVSATRPPEGWSFSDGQAISTAFKEATADGLEDVNSVLILVVKD